MLELEEISEMFDEVEEICEFGSLAVVKLSDASFWFCNRDVDVLTPEIEWRSAPVQMQEALSESLVEPEEKIMREEESDKNFSAFEYRNSSFGMERENMIEHTGSQEKYLNDFFGGAFDPRFGSDFSL